MKSLDKISEMYAFVCCDEGREGIVGMTMPVEGRETFMPFVCADKGRMEQLKPIALKISKEANKTIKIIKFTHRIDIEII